MNRIILGIICLITLQNAKAQFSLDHYHPVKRIAEEGIDTCSVYLLNPDSSLTIEQSYIYDTMGLEIENRRDFQEFSFIYNYNENGDKVAEYFVPFGEDYYERDTLLYDQEGRLIKKITFNRNGTESKRNEYDYQGNLLKEERYILKGKLQTRSLYSYDNEKQLTKIERFFRGKHNEDWVHEYDNNGNLVSFITISANGDTTLTHKFEYNSAELKVQQSVYLRGMQLNSVFKTTYDSKGLILWMETISGIQNNDPTTGKRKKTIYQYTYR